MASGPGGGLEVFGPLRTRWIAAGGAALVALFLYLGFPYERLAAFLAARAGAATGAQISFGAVAPSLQLAGPGVTATGVRAALGRGEPLRFDRVVLRPAWSLDWLRGRPAIHARLEGPAGRAVGVFTLGAGLGYLGEIAGAAAEALPLAAFWPGAAFDGTLDASLDLRREAGGPRGRASFQAREGSVALSGFPMALPFETLSGALRFGDGVFVEIESLALEGPLLDAEVTGQVGEALTFDTAPLQIQIQLTAEPALRDPLRMAGVRIGEDGSARVRIAGTAGHPLVR